MKLKLSLPSKSFLVGEYLVLENGPAVILNTEPRFELRAEISSDARCGGIHPDSPAGLWMRGSAESYQDLAIDFIDPHLAAGGFGASSAQFAFIYYVETIRKSHVFKVNSNLSYEKLWKSFRSTVFKEGERIPSGADIVGQVSGGISIFNQNPFTVNQLKWAFENKGFALVHMGQKINTHDHLKNLKKIPALQLSEFYTLTLDGLTQKDWSKFCSGVNSYADILASSDLTCERTAEFMTEAKKIDGVDAIKGCGALGADVALICFDKLKMNTLVEFLRKTSVRLIADDTKLSAGIDVKLELESSVNFQEGPML